MDNKYLRIYHATCATLIFAGVGYTVVDSLDTEKRQLTEKEMDQTMNVCQKVSQNLLNTVDGMTEIDKSPATREKAYQVAIEGQKKFYSHKVRNDPRDINSKAGYLFIKNVSQMMHSQDGMESLDSVLTAFADGTAKKEIKAGNISAIGYDKIDEKGNKNLVLTKINMTSGRE